jgi:hypothetical protein
MHREKRPSLARCHAWIGSMWVLLVTGGLAQPAVSAHCRFRLSGQTAPLRGGPGRRGRHRSRPRAPWDRTFRSRSVNLSWCTSEPAPSVRSEPELSERARPMVTPSSSFSAYLGSLHESALSVRHLGRSMNALRAGMAAPPLMAAARVAAGVTSLTCQEPTFTGPLPNRRSRPSTDFFAVRAFELAMPAIFIFHRTAREYAADCQNG